MESNELQQEIATANENAAYFLKVAGAPIVDAALYAGAAETLQSIKARARQLDDREKAITRPLNESLRSIRDLFRAPKDLLAQAEVAIKRGMLTFQRAEEQKRMEAQRVAEELARKERERLAELARKAEKRGDSAKAEQFTERAAVVVAPIVQTQAPRAAGISTRKYYKPEITDEALIPREYLTPDLTKIGKVVRALGPDANIPGVRVIEEVSMSSRAFG